MDLKLVKYHAQGNDYLILRNGLRGVDEQLVAQLCDRRKGVGADGLLVAPHVSESTPLVRIFNSDGSETERSGNGMCIFARFLVDSGYAPPNEAFVVRTLSGPAWVQLVNPSTGCVCTNMGPYSTNSSEIPMGGRNRRVIDEELRLGDRSFRINGISLGNPHCVVYVPKADRVLAEELGPAISHHPQFVHGANVQFAEVVDRNNILIQIWERGSGYTLSSGSSSCAAVCAGVELGYLDRRVTVGAPGGDLFVEVRPDRNVLFETIVTPVCSIEMLHIGS